MDALKNFLVNLAMIYYKKVFIENAGYTDIRALIEM